MSVNLRSLIGKLDDTTRGALEAAAGLCLGRTHYDVELEHFLMKLLDAPGSDFQAIMKHYGLDRSRLAAELTRALDRLKSGNARTPSLSPSLVRAFTEAWTIASIDFGAPRVRTGQQPPLPLVQMRAELLEHRRQPIPLTIHAPS